MGAYDDMSSFVLGGIGDHRFLIIKGSNLITSINDRSFEFGISNWSQNGVDVISRGLDDTTPFGKYVLRIVDDNAAAEEYAQFDINDSDKDFDERAFVLYFWAKGDSVTTRGSIEVYTNSVIFYDLPIVGKELGLTEYWKPCYLIIQVPVSFETDQLQIRFKPSYIADPVTSVGTMYIDNVNLYELSWDFEIRAATRMSQEWIKENAADYKLASGYLKEYIDGFRYKCELNFDGIGKQNEAYRSKVMTASLLFFIPHSDYNWGILVKPDDDLKRDYLADKYIGHTGNIKLIGIELLNNDNCLLIEDDYIGPDEFEFIFYEDDIDPVI